MFGFLDYGTLRVNTWLKKSFFKEGVTIKLKVLFKTIGLLILLLYLPLQAYAATYTYDAVGRLTSITYENGKQIIYSYNAAGRLSSVRYSEATPPTVISTDPANGAVDIPVDKTVYITFSENIQPGDNYGGIILKAGETVVAVSYGVSGQVLTIDPVSNLDYSISYAVYVPAGAVKDMAGNNLVNQYTFGFTTSSEPGVTPPTVTASPQGGLYNAAQSVTLTASEPATIYYTTDGTDPTTESAQYTGPVSITSSTTLKFMAVDQADNQSVIYTETYTIDTAAPTVTGAEPADGTTGVAVDANVSVNFSENIVAGANIGGVSITAGATTVGFTYGISNNVMTLDPDSNFDYSVSYTVSIPTGAVQDLAGNDLASEYTFGFTSTEQTDVTPPAVSITAPANGSTVGPSGEVVTITANATDLVGVTKVEFYVDGVPIGEDSVAPYTYGWQATVGSHTLTAKAYDAAGNVGTSSNITVYVPAKVTVTYPADDSTVGGIITHFDAMFSDPIDGYAYLYIDGDLKTTPWAAGSTNVSISYNWDTNQYADGTSHNILVGGYAQAGHLWSSKTIAVTINNSI